MLARMMRFSEYIKQQVLFTTARLTLPRMGLLRPLGWREAHWAPFAISSFFAQLASN